MAKAVRPVDFQSTTVARLFHIISFLLDGGNPKSALDISEAMVRILGLDSTSKSFVRTVQRDLEVLTLSFPMYVENEDSVPLYGIDATLFNPLKALPMPASIAATLMTVVAGALYNGGAMTDHVLSLANYLKTVLPIELALLLDDAITNALESHPAVEKQTFELVEQLLNATIYRKKMLVEYRPARSPKMTVQWHIAPVEVFTKNGAVYVAAYIEELRQRKLLRIERILTAYTLSEVAEHALCNPDKYMAWGHDTSQPLVQVAVRLYGEAANTVLETRVHPSQKVGKPNRDGSVDVTFEVTGVEEIKTWILSMGGDAEVLSPLPLREAIQAEVLRLLTRYCVPNRAPATPVAVSERQLTLFADAAA